jgi:NAD(P)-dependent dehydrogenase (short-subunit alcohol dehydrogenase family)
MVNFSDVVVLITGATSGIGKASAELLAARGYRVFGTSRHPSGKKPRRFELMQLDVTSADSVSTCVAEIAGRTGGRIDVLLNNAGTGILGAAEEVTPEEAPRLVQVNLFGIMRMTSAVLPLMRARRSGTIINMSSSGGIASVPFAGLYCATKHALEAYTAALRHELRPLGVTATVVAPGPVSTPAGDNAARAAAAVADYAERRARADSLYTRAIRTGMDPVRVARTILRVVRTRRPRPRYPVGLQARTTGAARKLLPPSGFEAAVRWGLRLG